MTQQQMMLINKIIVRCKSIPDFHRYKIDISGNIFSCLRLRRKNGQRGGFESYISNEWKQLKPTRTSRGYLSIALYKNKKQYIKLIHRLVLETFIGKCPRGMQACHNNGIRTDSRLENLRWDTVRNNHLDKRIHGTSNPTKGERHPFAKLNESQVKRIRLMKEVTPEFGYHRIAKMFNVSWEAIRDIIKRRNWKHI